MAADVAAWQECGVGGGGQLEDGGSSLARAWYWRRWQCGGGVGSDSVAAWQRGGGSVAVAAASLAAEAARQKRIFGGSVSRPKYVSIHYLRTVAPCYGELLALLVYLTWLLHVGPGFETHLVPLSLAMIYHSALHEVLYSKYVAAPRLMPARESSCWWLLDRVWRALTPPILFMISSLHTHTCAGEC